MLISEAYEDWYEVCEKRVEIVKRNEEKINDFFINLYAKIRWGT